MKNKNLFLIILAVVLVFVATAAGAYFFLFKTSSVSENNNGNNEWRAAADLSKVSFENLETKNPFTYNNKTISFSSGLIKNPATSDKQRVRIYSPGGENLPLVVLVPGGTSDGTDFEKTKGGASEAVKLAAENFVVIVYSPLGTGRGEGEMNYQGFDDQDGLAAIVAAGKKLDGVDQNNIGLASFSYGVTGAAGVLARYPDLKIKFFSDWEGPSSRSFTSVGCRNVAAVKKDTPGAFACDDEDHWFEREAASFIKEANVQYYWRIQQKEDHVQKTYGHTLEMAQAALGNVPWIKVNDGEINAKYNSETELPIVENDKDFFEVYALPHIIEMSKM